MDGCSRASARPTRPSASTCTPDGFPVDVLVSVSLARDADGRAAQLHRPGAGHDRAQAGRARARRAPAGAGRARRGRGGRRDDPASLQRITDVALRHLSLDDLLRELLAQISDILEVEGAAIGLLDPTGNTLVIEATYGYAQTVERGFAWRSARASPAGSPRPASRPVIAAAAGIEPLEPFLRQAGIGSLLGVPLRNEGRTIGVLHVGTKRSREFSRGHVAAAAGGRPRRAGDRARALLRARARRRRDAPALAAPRAAAAAARPGDGRALPARRARADVGGDWYDAIALEGGQVGLAMGDVVGHGLEAASLMGQLRNALRAYALEEHPPGIVVEKLDTLVQSLEPGGWRRCSVPGGRRRPVASALRVRRAPAAAAGRPGRRGALRRGGGVGAARRDARRLRGGGGRDRAGVDARALHRRPGRGARRADRRRAGAPAPAR